jgi:serine protease
VDWLVIDEINPGAGANGDFPAQYRVQTNRNGLNSGVYNATITIESETNQVEPVEIPVTMQVAAPPILTVSPDSLFLGTTLSSAVLTVGQDGPGSITYSAPEVDASWLEIEAIEPVASEPPIQYRVQVDRVNLDPGEYEATITFASDNNTVEVSVVMQVADVADVVESTLYVQLIDPDSFETVYRQTVTSEAGLYRFNFAGVAAGRYLIFAGTNLDNDALIGDAGEVNGAYLSLAQPVTLQVDQNLSGLNFDTGFNLILSAQARQASVTRSRPEFIPAF